MSKENNRQEVFQRQAETIFEAMGAERVVPPASSGLEPYQKLSTVGGTLTIHVITDTDDSPWIACRFEDPHKVIEIIPFMANEVNAHSGKWNHLYWEDLKSHFWPGFSRLIRKLDRVMA